MKKALPVVAWIPYGDFAVYSDDGVMTVENWELGDGSISVLTKICLTFYAFRFGQIARVLSVIIFLFINLSSFYIVIMIQLNSKPEIRSKRLPYAYVLDMSWKCLEENV